MITPHDCVEDSIEKPSGRVGSMRHIQSWKCTKCGSRRWQQEKPDAEALGWEVLDCDGIIVNKIMTS